MSIRATLWAVCTLALATSAGCVGGSGKGAGTPEALTLYSIDGQRYEPGKEPASEEKFHGYPVLGKVEIADLAARQELAAALRQGLAESDGTVAKCFIPRHALRAVENGRTVDYVICFQCLQLEEYEGDARSTKPVTRGPQSVFNKHLKEAGIPLATGAE